MIKATDDGLKRGAEVLTADSQTAKKKLDGRRHKHFSSLVHRRKEC